MNKFYHNLKPVAAAAVLSGMAVFGAAAQDYTPDFNEEGMYFQIISSADKTVRVVPVPDSQRYTGDGIVPRRVSWNDVDYTVVEIGDYAFDASGIVSTSLPSTIRKIGKYAYRNCRNLTAVTIPGSSENTGNWAFQGCTALTDITIEDGVKIIDAGSFREVGASEIRLPQSVTVIESDAFSFSRQLESIVIPDLVETIGNGALSYCDALKSITFGKAMKSLPVAWIEGDYALEEFNVVPGNACFAAEDGVLYSADMKRLVRCPVMKTSIVIPDGVEEIADWGLDHCWNLKSVDFGASLRKIGASAFKLCNEIEEVILPETIEELGNYAFMQCDNLKRVVLGRSIRTLGSGVFYKDKIIEEITCHATVPPATEANEFWSTVYASAVLNVPAGCADAYKEAEEWKRFADIRELPYQGSDGVEMIGTADGEPSVAVADGKIILSGTDTFTIYNTGGMAVRSGRAGVVEGLPAGLYIVRVGTRSVKVRI